MQFEEVKQQAPKQGVSVTTSDVSTFIANLVKQKPYDGDASKFNAALKAQGLSMKAAQQEVFLTLLQQKIRAKVTSTASVTVSQEHAYYTVNISSFETSAATTRSVEYILFKCAATGTTTCPAAKNRRRSRKPTWSSRNCRTARTSRRWRSSTPTTPRPPREGGKFTLTKGGVVPAFGTAGFALKTGQFTQQPVDATSAANQGYGWFLIKALAPATSTKAHTTSFAKAQASIEQTLLGQHKRRCSRGGSRISRSRMRGK